MINASYISREQLEISDNFDNSDQFPLLYTVLEVIVAVTAFLGNLLVIIVFLQDKRLRKVTNFYIISLAIADLFVGLIGIPSAILIRLGIPRNSFNLCLTMLSLLVVLCTISILNLVAVSLDRYWAILRPLDYHRRMSEQTAMAIIISCWIIGALIGFTPLIGWNNGPDISESCLFIPVMNYDFLVFLYFTTIVLPAVVMAFCYCRIYLVVVKQVSVKRLRRISRLERNANGDYNSNATMFAHNNSIIREDATQCNSIDTYDNNSIAGNASSDVSKSRSTITLESINTSNIVKSIKFSYSGREVKKAQQLFIIVVFFMLCWIPLYTSNTIQAFCDTCRPPSLVLLDILIILSHINSAGSPFLYAFHLKDFREALKRLFCKCVISQQHLRDLRRQELVSISGIQSRRITNAIPIELLVNTPQFSPQLTPELSPNQSLNRTRSTLF